MIKTWTIQQSTQNTLASFVAQLENSLKQSLTMNLSGTKVKIALNQTSFLTNLNTLALNAVRYVKKTGLDSAK